MRRYTKARRPEVDIKMNCPQTSNEQGCSENLIISFSIVYNSCSQISIKYSDMVFIHDEMENFDSKGQGFYYPFSLSSKKIESDEAGFGLPVPLGGVSINDELRFHLEYLTDYNTLVKRTIVFQYDGSHWNETNNTVVLKTLNDKNRIACDIDVISEDDLSLKLNCVEFLENRMAYYFTALNKSDRNVIIARGDLFLSIKEKGTITQIETSDSHEVKDVAEIQPHSKKVFIHSICDCPLNGYNRKILTELLNDSSKIQATVSFSFFYRYNNDDADDEMLQIGGVGDYVINELAIVPNKPYLGGAPFEYSKEEKDGFITNNYCEKDNCLRFEDFLVYSANRNCALHHKTETVTAVVDIIKYDGTETQAKINAAYCADCDKYYILDSEYRALREKGVILCQQMEVKEWIKMNNGNSISYLNPKSKLMLLGYNVKESENPDDNKRQFLLRCLIDSGVMTQQEVITHLQFLIKYNSNNTNFRNALTRWQRDLEFITDYNLESYPKIGVRSLKRKMYIKK